MKLCSYSSVMIWYDETSNFTSSLPLALPKSGYISLIVTQSVSPSSIKWQSSKGWGVYRITQLKALYYISISCIDAVPDSRELISARGGQQWSLQDSTTKNCQSIQHFRKCHKSLKVLKRSKRRLTSYRLLSSQRVIQIWLISRKEVVET